MKLANTLALATAATLAGSLETAHAKKPDQKEPNQEDITAPAQVVNDAVKITRMNVEEVSEHRDFMVDGVLYRVFLRPTGSDEFEITHPQAVELLRQSNNAGDQGQWTFPTRGADGEAVSVLCRSYFQTLCEGGVWTDQRVPDYLAQKTFGSPPLLSAAFYKIPPGMRYPDWFAVEGATGGCMFRLDSPEEQK